MWRDDNVAALLIAEPDQQTMRGREPDPSADARLGRRAHRRYTDEMIERLTPTGKGGKTEEYRMHTRFDQRDTLPGWQSDNDTLLARLAQQEIGHRRREQRAWLVRWLLIAAIMLIAYHL